MKKACVITGATGDLGKYLSIESMERQVADKYVLLYRSEEKLQSIKKRVNQKDIFYVYHDMSKRSSEDIFDGKIFDNISDLIVVLSAFDIKPIKKLSRLTKNECYNNICTNINGQLEVILELLQIALNKNINMRIISIDSGASYENIEGWSLYSCAKTYVNKFLEYVNLEEKIDVVMYSPGVINTNMQEYIRSVDEKDCPTVSNFINKFYNGQLRKPEMVAHDIIERYIMNWTAKEIREKVSNVEMREGFVKDS